MNPHQSKEEAIAISTDGVKVEYPKRKALPEKEDNEPSDILVGEEELFDGYIR